MKNLLISEKKLLSQYKKVIDEITEECDWKTHFSSEEVCGIVFGILVKNDIKPKICVEDFHKIYIKKVSEVSKNDKDWRSNYQIKDIINLIYSILKENKEIIW